jgi:hypothetical protein
VCASAGVWLCAALLGVMLGIMHHARVYCLLLLLL